MSKIQLVAEAIDLNQFDDKDLPSDTHLITFTKEGKRQVDAVRAYTMVDIFDSYYDKLGKDNPIHSIKSGYGRIKPKLYGKIKADNDHE
nr:hypothetical protein 18 [Paracoccaceae bacterium]